MPIKPVTGAHRSHHHLKSFSPQMAVPDNETKAGIFPGKVIIVDHGKIVRIDLPSIPKITYLRLFCFLASAQ